MADIDIIVDNSDVKESRLAMKAWAKEVRDSIREVNRSMSLQGKESRRASAEAQRQFKSQKALTQQKSRLLAQESKELERLATKYKPLYAASKQYERALEELARAHKLGVISNQQHAASVDMLNNEYSQFQAGTAGWSNQFVQNSNRAGKSMNRFGMISQQVGYQVGDFFVQVQSGQNVMVAFAQQGTQLAGLLPGVAGAVVGIGLSLGGMLYQMARARNGSKEAEEALKTLRQEAESVNKEIESLSNTWEDFSLGRFSGQRVLEEQLERAKEKADAARIALEDLQNRNQGNLSIREGGVGPDLRNQEGAEKAAAEALKQAEEELARLKEVRIEQARRLATEQLLEISNTNTLLSLERQYGAESTQVNDEILRQKLEQKRVELESQNISREDIALILQQVAENHNLTQELVEQAIQQELINSRQSAFLSNVASAREELYKSQQEGQKLADEMLAAYYAGKDLAEVNIAAGVDAASIAAGELSRQLGVSLSIARGMVRLAQAGITAAPNGPDQALNNVRDNLRPNGINEADIVSRVSISARGTSGGSSGRSGGRSGGGGSAKKEQEKTLEMISKEIVERDRLANAVGRQGEQMRLVSEITKSLGDSASKYSEEQIASVATIINMYREQQQALEDMRKEQQSLVDSLTSSMEDSLMSIADRSSSVKDAFRDMARSMVAELYKVLVVQRLVGSFNSTTGVGSGLAGVLGPLTGGLFANANGNSFSNGRVTPFANGGVVNGPTTFPMRGGTGLMGEAGPEAIMPLSRGSDGKLGVHASGATGNVYITQTFSFQANGDDSVKRIIAQEAPKIAKLTERKIIESRRKGGVMKGTFG